MFLDAAVARMKFPLLLCIDTLVKRTAKAKPDPDRVLIVRLDAIGDFILWLAAAQAIAEHYKARGKTVLLAANAVWADWAREQAIFDDVIAIDVREFRRSARYRYRAGRSIAALGCVIAVEPTYTRTWLLGDSVVRVSGARERIGSVGDGSNRRMWQMRLANSWYTQLLAADPSPCMELERNAEFVRNLGEPGFRARIPRLKGAKALRPDPNFVAATAGQPYYVLFPGASWNGKRWPVSRFREVAERLYRQTGWQGIVCGGSLDDALAAALCGRSAAPMLNWAARTDLAQFAAVLAGARLVLSNDTSAAHIASACGAPTVCVMGGGHDGRFLPYQVEQQAEPFLQRTVVHEMPCFGCGWQCIYKRAAEDPVPCIERIGVDEVWRAIGELLGFGT